MSAQMRSGARVRPAAWYAQRNLIATTLRNVWPSLPALTLASAAVCAAAVVPVIVAPGVSPVAAIVAALTIGPCWLALVAVVQQMADDDHGAIVNWWATLRRRWRQAIAQALVAAVPLALFVSALHVLDVTGAWWVWPSVACTGAATVIAALALCAAGPLTLADPGLRGRPLWLAAIGLVAARPVRFAAVAAAGGFAIWLAQALTASLLLFAPAPAAIVAVTATWTTVTAISPAAEERPAARSAVRPATRSATRAGVST